MFELITSFTFDFHLLPLLLAMSCQLTTKLANIILILPAVMSLLSNCSNQQTTDQWANATIDTRLSKDSFDKQLDKENEIFSALENRDPLAKRTSNVAYFPVKELISVTRNMLSITIAEPIFLDPTPYRLT